MVATPHFYNTEEGVQNFLARRREGASLLSGLLTEKTPNVYLGAEVFLTAGIDLMEDLDKLCIYGTNTLLVEMPFTEWNKATKKTVERLCRKGFSIVLAHINRYPKSQIEALFERGAVGQLNVEALLPVLGASPHIRRWIQEGKVVALGSDIHGSGSLCLARRMKRADGLALALKEKIENRTQELLKGAVPLGDISHNNEIHIEKGL